MSPPGPASWHAASRSGAAVGVLALLSAPVFLQRLLPDAGGAAPWVAAVVAVVWTLAAGLWHAPLRLAPALQRLRALLPSQADPPHSALERDIVLLSWHGSLVACVITAMLTDIGGPQHPPSAPRLAMMAIAVLLVFVAHRAPSRGRAKRAWLVGIAFMVSWLQPVLFAESAAAMVGAWSVWSPSWGGTSWWAPAAWWGLVLTGALWRVSPAGGAAPAATASARRAGWRAAGASVLAIAVATTATGWAWPLDPSPGAATHPPGPIAAGLGIALWFWATADRGQGMRPAWRRYLRVGAATVLLLLLCEPLALAAWWWWLHLPLLATVRLALVLRRAADGTAQHVTAAFTLALATLGVLALWPGSPQTTGQAFAVSLPIVGMTAWLGTRHTQRGSVARSARRAAGVLVLIWALCGAPWALQAPAQAQEDDAAPSATAPWVVFDPAPTAGKEGVLRLTTPAGDPWRGATVRVTHRPGLAGEREVGVGITDSSGALAWTPEIGGIALLRAGAQTQRVAIAWAAQPADAWVPALAVFMAGLALLGAGLYRRGVPPS